MKALLMLLFATPALAAPKIEVFNVKPDSVKPEVEITITVSKSGGDCDVRLDFGDGRARTIDFGLATTRNLHYTYTKPGSYKVTAKGTGRTPCEGTKEAALTVKGPAEKKAPEKKAPEKKAEKKKAEKKKADKKSAPKKKKKEEPK